MHTKGPWHISEHEWVCGPAWTLKAGGTTLASSYEMIGLVSDKNVADAHLIAAAPDLLEACKSALVTLRVLQPHSSAIIRELEAALKKAKGE